MKAKGHNFGFEFYGDWENFSSSVRYMESEAMVDDIMDDLERLGYQIEYAAKNHIMSQDLGWTRLSPVTIARKDDREEILIDTLEYAKSITSNVKQRWKRYIELTVWPEGEVKDRGISFQRLAYWHEYGTKYMPQRPLWRPVFDEVDGMEAFKAVQSLNHLIAKMIPNK
jgi:hypothetical protein